MASDDATLNLVVEDKASEPISKVKKGLDELVKASKEAEDQVNKTNKTLNASGDAMSKTFNDAKDGLGENTKAGGEFGSALEGLGVVTAIWGAQLAVVGKIASTVFGTAIDLGTKLYARYQKIDDAQDAFQIKEGEVGIERLNRMVDAGDAMGKSIDEIREQAVKLEGAFDPENVEDLQKIIGDLALHGTKDIAANTEALTDQFTKLGVRAKDVLKAGDLSQFGKFAGTDMEKIVRGELAKSLGTTTDQLDGLIKKGKVSVTQFIEAAAAADKVGNKTTDFGEAAKKFADQDLGAQVTRVKNQFGLLGDELAKAVFGGDGMADTMKKLADKLELLSKSPEVKVFFAKLGMIIQMIGESAGPILIDVLDGVGTAIKWISANSELVEDVLLGVAVVVGVIAALIAGTLLPVIIVLGAVIGIVIALGAEIALMVASAGPIWDAFTGTLSSAGNRIIFGWNNMIDYFSKVPAAMESIGSDIIDGLIKGIEKKMDDLKNVSKTAGDNVKNGLKDTLGIHSPSTVMMELGEYTSEGFVQGLDKGNDKVRFSTDQMTGAATAGASAGSGSGAGPISITFGDVNITTQGNASSQELADLITMEQKRMVMAVVQELFTQAQGQQ